MDYFDFRGIVDMGYFALSKDKTPKELIKAAVKNLELYTDNVEGQYKDSIGQTPPDYLIKNFAMSYLKEALEALEK